MHMDTGDSRESDAKQALLREIRHYWNSHFHDLEIATHPVGSLGFFDELTEYRQEKLRYLPRTVDFRAYEGQRVLEVGAGLGIDLAMFAERGAKLLGVDLAERSIALAKRNFRQRQLESGFAVMNGEKLALQDDQFDLVYAHGVIQYTADPHHMVREIHRVLRPGGEAILMVYNRQSWLYLLSKLAHVSLEHEDAPVMRQWSMTEFANLLREFTYVDISPERFPVKTQLHGGIKGLLFNSLFVPFFNLIPRSLTRRVGWHLIAKAVK